MDTTGSFADAGAASITSRWVDPFFFLGRAFASPLQCGALLPSSSTLGRTMAQLVRGQSIVELGPGSGSITRHLLARISPEGRILALELDAAMATHLGKTLVDPRLIVQVGNASHLKDCLSTAGWEQSDCIVSGLPFQAMAPTQRHAILTAARDSLSPSGRFIAFQYGLRLLPTFKRHFRKVKVVGPIWNNLPPAYVVVGLAEPYVSGHPTSAPKWPGEVSPLLNPDVFPNVGGLPPP